MNAVIKTAKAIPALLLVLQGCADVDRATDPGPARSNSMASISNSMEHPRLPYGLRVPAGVEIDALPEPYDPKRHGPLLRNSTPEANRAGTPLARELARGRFGANDQKPPVPGTQSLVPGTQSLVPGTQSLVPGTGDRGRRLWPDPYQWYGAHAVHDVRLDLTLPSPDSLQVRLYAPTLMPPSGACLETVTTHFRFAPGAINPTRHFHGFWDWCESGPYPGGWALFEEMDSVFQNKYVRTIGGDPILVTSVTTINSGPSGGVYSDQCWYGALYNFLIGGYEQKASRCGTSYNNSVGRGWTMWESYYLDAVGCPNIVPIQARDIQLAHPQTSTWVPFTNYPDAHSQLGPTGTCWTTAGYTFTFPIDPFFPNGWRANTP